MINGIANLTAAILCIVAAIITDHGLLRDINLFLAGVCLSNVVWILVIKENQ